MQSLVRALRSLLRTPGFALVAVVTLGLAIASIGTLYAVVDAVLLKPLPFPDAQRIIRIIRVQGACADCPVSRPTLLDWEQQATQAFEALGAFDDQTVTITGDGAAERVYASRVTPGFWDVMQVPPLLGRTFTAEEDREARALVVISHGFWQRRFGGETGAIGRTLTLDGQVHEVVGVMPEYFTYPGADALLPASLARLTTDRDTNYLSAVGRLRPDVTLEQAHEAMAVLGAREKQAYYAGRDEVLGARLLPLQERVTGAVRPALTLMFAASAMVVLIACANLANLMLARARARRRELAVRSALGAGRGRLLWNLGAEAVVIAIAGLMLGLALAIVAIHVLPKLAPDLLPAYNPLAVDAGVVAFAAGIAVVALLAFGLGPAWRYARSDPAAALQDEARGGAGGRASARARAGLVVGEVALSVVLLAGAALLIESSRRLSNVDPAVDVEEGRPPTQPKTAASSAILLMSNE